MCREETKVGVRVESATAPAADIDHLPELAAELGGCREACTSSRPMSRARHRAWPSQSGRGIQILAVFQVAQVSFKRYHFVPILGFVTGLSGAVVLAVS